MEVMLRSPESIIINQGDQVEAEECELYLIAKGKCTVTVRDKFDDRYQTKVVRQLPENSHFGEVAMIYPGAARSASVAVQKDSYLTCAKISRANYEELK